jgi:hypothetical protein
MRKIPNVLALLFCTALLTTAGCRQSEVAKFRDHNLDGFSDTNSPSFSVTSADLKGIPYDEQRPPRQKVSEKNPDYVNVALTAIADNTVNVNDTAVIPVFEWVTVQNPTPVENGNGKFEFGDRCSVEVGHVVKVRAVDGMDILVEYQVPGIGFGAPCPNGVLFFTSREAFLRMTDQYVITRIGTERELTRVERLLAENS